MSVLVSIPSLRSNLSCDYHSKAFTELMALLEEIFSMTSLWCSSIIIKAVILSRSLLERPCFSTHSISRLVFYCHIFLTFLIAVLLFSVFFESISFRASRTWRVHSIWHIVMRTWPRFSLMMRPWVSLSWPRFWLLDMSWLWYLLKIFIKAFFIERMRVVNQYSTF